MQFCNSSQWAFELETLRTPQDIKTPIKMLLSHGSGSTDMISVQQTPKKELWCWVIILGLLWVAQKHFSQCRSVLGKTGAISVLVGTLKGPKQANLTYNGVLCPSEVFQGHLDPPRASSGDFADFSQWAGELGPLRITLDQVLFLQILDFA